MFTKSINIISDIITPNMPNYTLLGDSTNEATPITCDKDGNIISVFSDNVWDFSPYSIKPLKFSFNSVRSKTHYGYHVNEENIKLFKAIIVHWLWGAHPRIDVKTLITKCSILKPIFSICSKHDILITELSKHKEIYREIANSYQTKRRAALLLQAITFNDDIGFTIFDEESIVEFSAYLVLNESQQTPYIPPRIWSYQLARLEEFIDDFLSIEQSITSIFNNFKDNHNKIKEREIRQFNKEQFNKHYDVSLMLQKWTNFDFEKSKVSNLSSYLSMASFVGIAFVVNFSLMRNIEAYTLRYGCFSKVTINGQEICLVKGVTTKTVQEKEASWVVSPAVEKAIRVLQTICELRFSFAKEELGITQDIAEYKPFLNIQAFEPWVRRLHKFRGLEFIKTPSVYQNQIMLFNKLFDKNELKMTKEDFNLACQLTPSLDKKKFKVGEPWQFTWHQLRRTGAVNMLASGLITEQSLQYQLKHANTIMSLYYANNYYKLKFKLDEGLGSLYLEEWHQNNVRKNEVLVDKRFISPHGEKRKAQIISPITEKDHKTLIQMSKKGNLNYRETFLGGCTKNGSPCPYGGITNIVMCMGGDGSQPCESLLLDADKLGMMYKQEKMYLDKIQRSIADSIDTTFQEQQLNSIRKAIHVIESNQ
ncbi:hypothetical protein MOTT16_03075 [Moraxella osloensis]|uniref:Integrase n=1 Tax=Faucicola osloensis TaxID=34062 RepID=A0AAD0EWQ2_FAUOS|nr:hypothetical protein [Moraxella osloensis]ATQ82891.1 hypothetical protein YHS_03080 [Moraxella osloensis]ATW85391.1 hypothetical protein MOTT16_03075 [Moraxella osloensis]